MTLEGNFDAVLMLTWSNWKTEPRSNRYHYATRFARHVPVLFFQPWAPLGTKLTIEATEISNLDIVHAPYTFELPEISQVQMLLRSRGIKRPLLWIYDSLHYQNLIDNLDHCFKAYHATEDYFTESSGFSIDNMSSITGSIRRLLPKIDLLVAVSEGVRQSYLQNVDFKGNHLVLENGCDAEFYFEYARAATIDSASNIAFFQGGINSRVDFSLLCQVARALPHWKFKFCGTATSTPGWRKLLKESNVEYLGFLEPKQIAKEMANASVGIIPFIQDQLIRNSLPLKAYEYVACGLPVVTVPIDALATDPELFFIATTPASFAEQIEIANTKRHDADLLKLRALTAGKNSYDARFEKLRSTLANVQSQLQSMPKRLNIAVLFDQSSAGVGTIREHLNAFHLFSKNDISYFPCTWTHGSNEILQIDLSIFDAVIVHYSVRLSLADHLNKSFAAALERFNGFKVLFIQDEYDTTEIARAWMDRINFNIVYTCIPQISIEQVYPSYRFPSTEFIQTLTGYVPEDSHIERFSRPLSERTLLIGYRGRKLPTIYGSLGREKYQIGVTVKEKASEKKLPVDIEVEDSKRIYGDDWYAFLGSVRATLGTESGSNIFDFDGSLQTQITKFENENPRASFERVAELILAKHEGSIQMNQISPKVFEAIRLRTALVLFEGSYSGVVQADTHYLPLKKDFSNLNDIFKKLEDDVFVHSMTERAYLDIVASGIYSHRRFIESVDQDFSTRIGRAKKRQMLVGMIYSLDGDGTLKPALPMLPLNLAAGASILDCKTPISAWVRQTGGGQTVAINSASRSGPFLVRWLRWLWYRLPLGLRNHLTPILEVGLGHPISGKQNNMLVFRTARAIWNLLPHALQTKIARMVRSN